VKRNWLVILRNDERFRSLDVITEVEWVKEHLSKRSLIIFFVCIKVEREFNGWFKSTVVGKVKL